MWNPLDGLATVNVRFKRLNSDAHVPFYASAEAAGADLFASERTVIPAGGQRVVGTGIAIELPLGFEAQVRPRSGLAAKHGISINNTPGTIDSDYRGEIKVILINHSSQDFTVDFGHRIAQLVIVPIFRAVFVDVPELGDTQRDAGGLGSTGK
jgi:dUTP pyrophosphatase